MGCAPPLRNIRWTGTHAPARYEARNPIVPLSCCSLVASPFRSVIETLADQFSGGIGNSNFCPEIRSRAQCATQRSCKLASLLSIAAKELSADLQAQVTKRLNGLQAGRNDFVRILCDEKQFAAVCRIRCASKNAKGIDRRLPNIGRTVHLGDQRLNACQQRRVTADAPPIGSTRQLRRIHPRRRDSCRSEVAPAFRRPMPAPARRCDHLFDQVIVQLAQRQPN